MNTLTKISFYARISRYSSGYGIVIPKEYHDKIKHRDVVKVDLTVLPKDWAIAKLEEVLKQLETKKGG